jgi:hypothetical protein
MPRNTTRRGQSQGQGRSSRVRLGAGDFVAASAPNPFARVRYLLAVERCVPEALQALAARGGWRRPRRLGCTLGLHG